MMKVTDEMRAAWNKALAERAKSMAVRELRGPYKRRCRVCRLKVRGPNHDDGWDHVHRVK